MPGSIHSQLSSAEVLVICCSVFLHNFVQDDPFLALRGHRLDFVAARDVPPLFRFPYYFTPTELRYRHSDRDPFMTLFTGTHCSTNGPALQDSRPVYV